MKVRSGDVLTIDELLAMEAAERERGEEETELSPADAVQLCGEVRRLREHARRLTEAGVRSDNAFLLAANGCTEASLQRDDAVAAMKYATHWDVSFDAPLLARKMRRRIDRLCYLWLEVGIKDPDRYKEFCKLVEQLDMLRRDLEPAEPER